MNALSYLELWRALLPEACLTLGALLILGLDLAAPAGRDATTRRSLASVLAFIAKIGRAHV